jgi:hypothetical protein
MKSYLKDARGFEEQRSKWKRKVACNKNQSSISIVGRNHRFIKWKSSPPSNSLLFLYFSTAHIPLNPTKTLLFTF